MKKKSFDIEKEISYDDAIKEIKKKLKSNQIIPNIELDPEFFTPDKNQLILEGTNYDQDERIQLDWERIENDMYSGSKIRFEKQNNYESVLIKCNQDTEGTNECKYRKNIK